MRDFQRKRGWRNIAESRPVLIFLAILLLFFIWQIFGFTGKMQMTRENRKIAENKVLELTEEKEKLSADIAKLKTEKGVEESIRDKFGLAKEGEGEIIVVEDKNSSEVSEKETNWFFGFFKNLFK